MARLLMTVVGALICGVAAWAAVGFIAAQVFTKIGTGAHDGGGAMAGFFFVGGIGGVLGAVAGAWIVWLLLADPARMGMVSGGLIGVLLLLVVGVFVAMMPAPYKDADIFPKGMRGELQVEARFPANRIADMGPKDALTFELRRSGFLRSVPWQRAQIRYEGDQAIVPGAFRVEEIRQWILAVMRGDQQLDTTDVGPYERVYTVNETTAWSEWTRGRAEGDSGAEYRWRFAVVAK